MPAALSTSAGRYTKQPFCRWERMALRRGPGSYIAAVPLDRLYTLEAGNLRDRSGDQFPSSLGVPVRDGGPAKGTVGNADVMLGHRLPHPRRAGAGEERGAFGADARVRGEVMRPHRLFGQGFGAAVGADLDPFRELVHEVGRGGHPVGVTNERG